MISRLSNSSLWKLQLQLQLQLKLKSLFRYSSAAAAAPSTVLGEFLVNSLGFSKEEALAATKKVPSSKSFRNDPNIVIGYFEKLGLNKPQIKSIVTAYPRILLPDPQKTFQPKIKALQDIGLSGSDLNRVLTSYGSLLCRPLETNILAPIEYLKSFLGSKELVCKVLLTHCSLLHDSTVKILASNIAYLQKLGFSEEKLSQMLIRRPRYLIRELSFLEAVVEKVENKYKISRNSKMFYHFLVVLCTNSTAAVEKKLNVFRTFGWSEENIHVMFRHVPYIVGFSEDRLRKQLEFYMNEVGYKPDFLTKNPVLLNYSLEKRVKPRVKIMKILMEKKLIDEKSGFHSGLKLKDLDFIRSYILPYLDDVSLSTTDLEFLKNYILPHKDEMSDFYASNLKLCGKSKELDKKTK